MRLTFFMFASLCLFFCGNTLAASAPIIRENTYLGPRASTHRYIAILKAGVHLYFR